MEPLTMSQVYTTDISDTQAETPTCNATLASPLNRYGLPPWGYSFVCRLSHAAASDLFVQKPDYDDYDVTEGELKCFGTASLEPGRTVRVHGESVCPPPGMSYKVKLTPSDVDPHSFKHEGTEVDFTAILDETGLWMKNSPRKGWVELEGYLSVSWSTDDFGRDYVSG